MKALLLGLLLTQQPDIILIIGDDIAVHDFDEARTPTIDSLASQSINFTHAYASPTCSIARHQMMLGLWTDVPGENPCEDGGSRVLGPDSLANQMKAGGYNTGIFGKWHLGSAEPWNIAPQQAGFDVARAIVPSNVKSCDPAPSDPFNFNGTYANWLRVDDGIVTEASHEYQTDAVSNTFVEWWTETPSPKFAVVSFQAAHGPFHRPPARLLPNNYPDTPTLRDKYIAMIVSLDTGIQNALAAVDLSETAVIFASDNGTPPQVTPPPYENKSKTTTFERGIHVPLMVHVPGVKPYVDHRLVSLVDVYDTILDIAEIKNEYLNDGISLLSSDTHTFVLSGTINFDDKASRSFDYKLRIKNGVSYFYDLEKDPLETINAINDPELTHLIDMHALWLQDL